MQVDKATNLASAMKAVLLAVLCMLSSGNGLVVWPAMLGLGLLLHIGTRQLLPMLLFGLLTVAIYGYGMSFTGVGSGSPAVVERIFYVAAFIGSPFSMGNVDRAIGIGALVAVVYFLLCLDAWKRNRRDSYVVLAWGVVSLLSALAGAMYRMSAGDVGQALVDRYVPLSVPLWISCIVGLMVRGRENRVISVRSNICVAITIVVASVASASSPGAFDPNAFVGSRHAYVRLAREAIDEDVFVTSRKIPWINLYPSPRYVLSYLRFLREEGLTPFRHPPRTKRIGTELKEAGWVCVSCLSGGTIDRVIEPMKQTESCLSWLDPGFAVTGNLHVKSSRVRDILITDSSKTVVGVGFPVPQFRIGWDWTEWLMTTTVRPWYGFVSGKVLDRQTRSPLFAYARLHGSGELIRLNSVVMAPSISVCSTQ